MEGKICPIMAQGFIVAYHEKSVLNAIDIDVNKNLIKRLPKCLKENCALWVETTCSDDISENKSGCCGLINRR